MSDLLLTGTMATCPHCSDPIDSGALKWLLAEEKAAGAEIEASQERRELGVKERLRELKRKH